MIRSILTVVALLTSGLIFAQEKEKIMETRAREMHAALTSPDREVWKKYINDNYSARLISARGLDKILDMWGNIQADFGDSKIVSTTFSNGVQEMIIKRNDDGHKVSFLLTPEASQPYKLDRIAIEAGAVQAQGGGGQQVVVRGGPAPGRGGAEEMMKKFLDVVSKGDNKAIDQFINTNFDATRFANMQNLKAEIAELSKNYKSHEVMSVEAQPDAVDYIIESTSTRKAKKINLQIGTNDKIVALKFSER